VPAVARAALDQLAQFGEFILVILFSWVTPLTRDFVGAELSVTQSPPVMQRRWLPREGAFGFFDASGGSIVRPRWPGRPAHMGNVAKMKERADSQIDARQAQINRREGLKFGAAGVVASLQPLSA
jgi:hypothetical protein